MNTLLIDVSGNNWSTSYLNTYNIKNIQHLIFRIL